MPSQVYAQVTAAPLIWGSGSGQDYAISLDGLSAAAIRQGVKGDLGKNTGGHVSGRFAVVLEWDATSSPTSGGTIDLYWAGSPSSTAATDNPGETTGADAAYSITDGEKQLELVGKLTVYASTNTQRTIVGVLEPKFRYGMPVVDNNASTAAASADLGRVYLYPIPDESL